MDNIINVSNPDEVLERIRQIINKPEMAQFCTITPRPYETVLCAVYVADFAFYIFIDGDALLLKASKELEERIKTYSDLHAVFASALLFMKKAEKIRSLKLQAIMAQVRQMDVLKSHVTGPNVGIVVEVSCGEVEIQFPLERFRQVGRIPELVAQLKRLSINLLRFSAYRKYTFKSKDVIKFLDGGYVRDVFSAELVEHHRMW